MSEKQKASTVRSNLPAEDQRELRWFFIEGQVVFDRSPMGYMLDRAETFTFGSMVCPACKGAGFPGDVNEAIREAIERAKKWEANSGKCLSEALREWRKEHDDEKPPWYDDGQCKTCGGCGWIPMSSKFPRTGAALTAIPKTATGSNAIEPSHDNLEVYGHVSRELRRIAAVHREVLEGFFGMPGKRHEDDRDRGRIWGVMHLTKSGKKLLAKSKSKSDLTLTDDQRLATQAELDLIQPDKSRSNQIERARAEAVVLLRAAEEAYARNTPVDVYARVKARLRGMVAA